MIHRSDIKDNFTRIQNTLLNDETISFKAKGLLVYLLSKPENWNVNIKRLTGSSLDGQCSTRAGLKELEQAGYRKLWHDCLK